MITTCLQLFWEFFKTGLFAVGGGMATLPFLQAIGESTGWYTYTDLMNMLAVWRGIPYFRQPAAMKPMSKSAL